MNKKVKRFVRGLGFFSIVVGLVFVGLVYGLKKDLMIAEIGKLFDYAIDFMFVREGVGRVLTARVIAYASLVVTIIWMVICYRRKNLTSGIFGSMGILGGTASLMLMYRYRKSLMANAVLTPGLGKAILIVFIVFFLLMLVNILAALLSVVLSQDEIDKEKYDSKTISIASRVSAFAFIAFAVLVFVACGAALMFKFEPVMRRAPKFYHFVLDLINVAKWDATNIVANFTAVFVLLCTGFWFVFDVLKKRLPIGPLSLVVVVGMMMAACNYEATFKFYLSSDAVYLKLALYVFYVLGGIAALAVLAGGVADIAVAAIPSKKHIDVINIQVVNGFDEVKVPVEEVVEVVKEEVVEPVKEEPVVEEVIKPAPVVEEVKEEETEEEAPAELGEDLIEVIDENNKKLIINKRLYTNKLCLSSAELKNKYNIIKNAIMKYNKVRSRISANYESFRKGRKLLIRFSILGKTLRVYLALDPNEYPVTVYHQRNEGDKKKYELVPMMLRVRSARSVRNAVKLIDELMEKEGIALAKSYEDVDYAKEFKYDSNALLIKDGFKKLVREEIDEAHADELSDDEALRVVVNKEVDETVEEKVVSKNEKVNKSIVNVDQINQVFEYDEYVTIEKMKEKGLVNKKTNYVKVLSRGVINKPMTIEANEFSLKAIKMIVLTGGSVVKLVSK